jgi:hypothetical protein
VGWGGVGVLEGRAKSMQLFGGQVFVLVDKAFCLLFAIVFEISSFPNLFHASILKTKMCFSIKNKKKESALRRKKNEQQLANNKNKKEQIGCKLFFSCSKMFKHDENHISQAKPTDQQTIISGFCIVFLTDELFLC